MHVNEYVWIDTQGGIVDVWQCDCMHICECVCVCILQSHIYLSLRHSELERWQAVVRQLYKM